MHWQYSEWNSILVEIGYDWQDTYSVVCKRVERIEGKQTEGPIEDYRWYEFSHTRSWDLTWHMMMLR